jgi:hypothetical protein
MSKTDSKTSAATVKTIYMKHSDGATHSFAGRRLAKFRAECKAGRGNEEITALLLAGYSGFLADGGDIEDLEALPAYLGAVAS